MLWDVNLKRLQPPKPRFTWGLDNNKQMFKWLRSADQAFSWDIRKANPLSKAVLRWEWENFFGFGPGKVGKKEFDETKRNSLFNADQSNFITHPDCFGCGKTMTRLYDTFTLTAAEFTKPSRSQLKACLFRPITYYSDDDFYRARINSNLQGVFGKLINSHLLTFPPQCSQ